MRLIDADAKMVAQLNDFETESVVEKEMTVDDYLFLSDYDAPTIDAEPVVRCKDCIYYETCNLRSSHWWKGGYTVDIEFCSFGERREP